MWKPLNKKTPVIRRITGVLDLVPVGGLEPPRPKATDFESVVYTNFTTPALIVSRNQSSGGLYQRNFSGQQLLNPFRIR